MVENNALANKIQLLAGMTYQNSQFSAPELIDASIRQAIDLFNTKELSLLEDMTGVDFAAHIYMHLIDHADTVNARFVWKRDSAGLAKKSKALTQAWNVAKAIKKNEFGTAFTLLDATVREESAKDFSRDCDVLRNILVWTLRNRTVPSMLRQCYSTIEGSRLK